MKLAIFPYNAGSNSAKVLSESLECKRIKHEGSKFNKWNSSDYWIINWGSSRCPNGSSVLNTSNNVIAASNKLSFFNLVKDHARVPDFTTDIEIAKGWFSTSRLVVCRSTCNGHSGEGITLANSAESLIQVPLYTRYVPKDSEWRLHFAFDSDQPFFVQKKVRKADYDGEHDNQIRNLDGGWVYAHNNLDVPSDVILQGREAFKFCKLDFGAIDIIYRKSHDKAYVLECNTAPGLMGETINKYAEQFKSKLTTA